MLPVIHSDAWSPAQARNRLPGAVQESLRKRLVDMRGATDRLLAGDGRLDHKLERGRQVWEDPREPFLCVELRSGDFSSMVSNLQHKVRDLIDDPRSEKAGFQQTGWLHTTLATYEEETCLSEALQRLSESSDPPRYLEYSADAALLDENLNVLLWLSPAAEALLVKDQLREEPCAPRIPSIHHVTICRIFSASRPQLIKLAEYLENYSIGGTIRSEQVNLLRNLGKGQFELVESWSLS